MHRNKFYQRDFFLDKLWKPKKKRHKTLNWKSKNCISSSSIFCLSASFLVSFQPPAHQPHPWKLSSAFRLQLSLLMPLLTILHPYWLLLLISMECMGRNEIRLFSFITLMALCDPSVNKLSFFLLNNNNNSLYYLNYKRLHHLVAKENLHINKGM